MIGLHMPSNPISGAAGSGSGRRGGFSSASSAAAAAAPTQTHQHRHGNVIRISPKTAPQIVSSVPKCPRNPKASRSHQMDTINGAEQQMLAHHHGYHHEYLSSQYEQAPMATSGSHHHHQLPGKKKKGGGGLKSHPLPLSTSSHHQMDDHQVVLIVNDDHKGAPIIGRRLPSKSMSSSALNFGPPSEVPEVACTMASTGGSSSVVSSKPRSYHDGQPVVGRRSHRLIQQNQQQRAGHIYQYERSPYPHEEYHNDSITMTADIGSSGCGGGGRRHTSHQKMNYSDHYESELQQPLSIVETQAVTSQQVLAISNHHNQRHLLKAPPSCKSKLRPTPDIANYNEHSTLDDYAKPPGKVASGSGHIRGRKFASENPSHLAERRSTSLLLASSSSSRSSASSASTSPPSCPAGCPCGANQLLLPYPVAPPPQHLVDPTAATSCTDSSCRHCYVEGSQQPSYHHDSPLNYLPLARSASCQRQTSAATARKSSCCTANIPKKRSSHARGAPRDCCPHLGVPSDSRDLIDPQRPTRSHISHHQYANNNYHHHHDSGDPMQPPVARPPVSYRSSSCHEPRPGHHHHRQQAPMLISGRNVLPVHPKPIIQAELLATGSSRASGGSQASRHAAKVAAHSCGGSSYEAPDMMMPGGDAGGPVGQMYESLAAELKAKLGDPKMGPILLPPKDYDTMSRKQGKLTGIELRRSTNPQLVGPTPFNNINNRMSNTNSQTSKGGCSMITEEVAASFAAASSTGGSRMDKESAAASPVYRAGGSSSRSSGRSQDDEEHSLHRSRSNSSSGLGSISMGAGSPNSSPSSKSSSSEDMRQASRLKPPQGPINSHHTTTTSNHYTKIIIGASSCRQNGNSGGDQTSGQAATNNNNNHHEEQQLRDTPKIQSKNSNQNNGNRSPASPDNCGASDSGHSDTTAADQIHKQRGEFSSNSSDNHYNHSKFETEVDEETNNNSKLDNNCANNNNNDRRTLINPLRPKAPSIHNPGVVSEGVLWNGRVEIPLKVNRDKNNGNTYLATKQIIY